MQAVSQANGSPTKQTPIDIDSFDTQHNAKCMQRVSTRRGCYTYVSGDQGACKCVTTANGAISTTVLLYLSNGDKIAEGEWGSATETGAMPQSFIGRSDMAASYNIAAQECEESSQPTSLVATFFSNSAPNGTSGKRRPPGWRA